MFFCARVWSDPALPAKCDLPERRTPLPSRWPCGPELDAPLLECYSRDGWYADSPAAPLCGDVCADWCERCGVPVADLKVEVVFWWTRPTRRRRSEILVLVLLLVGDRSLFRGRRLGVRLGSLRDRATGSDCQWHCYSTSSNTVTHWQTVLLVLLVLLRSKNSLNNSI